ncbi:beta-class phenol-soluble modulin [Staphylococcus lugdunensis]|nr:beta-class phenol-soluble modulin [Staphylococcus lugdunensis]EFU83627.1 hemolysin H1U [Staphylococcus lugdunensis M23590]SQE70832.1 Slush B [Staphylococcus lugdunensis]
MSGIIEAITKAVQAGLDKDWATMGTSIAEALAKGIDAIAGLFG